uniref:Calponin-homology (CH) domain-containing protein n=1 Tax=Chrysemys picta bellii TaxID=8478 RepID=A0A8C3IZF6_CHRPI
MSLRAYTARCRLNKLRRAACRLFTSETMVKAIKRLEFEIESRRLLVRKDRHLWKDIGERQKVLNWLLSYNPLWLRIGLETIYGELIALESNSDIMGLAMFILSRLLWNPDIAAEYRHPTVPHLYRDGHEEALSKFTLKKLLLLVCFLDHAKQSRIIDHDPCLFCKDAEFKNSKDVLLAFSRDFLSGEGDLSRHLGFLGLPVSHVQTPLDEFDFAVTNLAVDLQCGIRLVRTMELLTKNWSLSKKLRVPAISRLQKMHNVDVALHVLKERGIQLKDECGASIESRDIVDRHRERTLALLWKIAFAFQVDISLNVEQLEEEISFLKNTHNIKTKMATLVSCSNQSKVRKTSSTYSSESYSENVKLLMDWVNAVCGFYNTKVSSPVFLCIYFQVLYILHPCFLLFNTCVCGMSSLILDCDHSLTPINKNQGTKMMDTVPPKQLHSILCIPFSILLVVITYLSFLCSRLLDLRKETRAARLIQSVWRKYRLNTELKLHQEKDKAARIIQSTVINFLSHRRIQKKVNAAIFIQKHWRRYLAERKTLKLKKAKLEETKSESATVIQALFRGFKARQLAGKMRAARTIQAWFRRYRARKEYTAVVKATCVIQGYFKSKRQRTWFLKMKASTVTIQRRWRETLTAKTILLQFLATKEQQAACLIQAAYRGFKERHKFHQQKAAALVIQKHIRARQEGRLECIKYIKTRKAAIKLQAFFRGWLVRKKILDQKQKKRLLCFSAAAYHHLSAIKIQRAFRIHLVLKHAQMQISSVLCVQRWFRARLKQKKSLQDHQKIIKIQRMVRRWLKQRNEAATTIQRAVRKFLFYKHRRKLKNGIIKFQALWRGYSWRKKNDTAKTKALRCSLEMANKESKEENKLCNRTAVAIDYLLKYKHISYILAALKHLEVVTRLSPLCCENMAQSGAIFTIFILIRNCNRSIPCMEVIKYSVQVLLNVSKYERTTQAVYEVENSVDTLLDLLQMYREKAGDKTSEKGGSIFTKTCCLLAILLKDSKRASDIRSTSRAASRIHSLYRLTARKHKMDAERTLSKHKMHTSMNGSFFVPVTPVRTKVVSRIKPDWVLRKDNMQEIVDPLQAIRMVMDTLGTAYH